MRCLSLLRRVLAALVIEGVFPRKQDLRDRHDLIALLLEITQNFGQRLRRVLARIVKQHDGAGAHLACHALGDLRGGDALPVEAVPIPYKGKSAWRAGLRG